MGAFAVYTCRLIIFYNLPFHLEWELLHLQQVCKILLHLLVVCPSFRHFWQLAWFWILGLVRFHLSKEKYIVLGYCFFFL